jgi:Tfp pilus assembly protein PilE
MTELAPRYYAKPDPVSQLAPLSRFSGQPILIAAVAFIVVVLGIGSIAAWRAYTGMAPETDRVVATRQLQARTAQASEQLVEKTKGIEATQQESIDQLQVVQDQLLTVRRLLAAQQADTRKLSEQVGTLTESIDGLRQSFASAQTSEPSSPPSSRKRSIRRSHAAKHRSSKSAKLRRGRNG